LVSTTITNKTLPLIYSWGRNEEVELAQRQNTQNSSLPFPPKGMKGICKQIVSARSHTALLNTEGQIFVDQVPPLFREKDADPNTQYNPAVISWVDQLPSLIGAGENKGQVILYFAGGTGTGTFAPAAGTQLTFLTVFNAWTPTSLNLPNKATPTGTPWPDVVA
jgi:hypothetical protein